MPEGKIRKIVGKMLEKMLWKRLEKKLEKSQKKGQKKAKINLTKMLYIFKIYRVDKISDWSVA